MKDLKAQIRLLNQGELVELRTYISGLVSGGGGRQNVAPTAGLLLDVFEDCCRRYGLGFVPKSIKDLVRKREGIINGFMASSCPEAPPVIRRTILATGVDLLYQDLQANGRIISARALAYGLERLPAVLDHAFPGYASCGLLGKIVRRVA